MAIAMVVSTALDPVALALGSAVIASLLTGGVAVLTNLINLRGQASRDEQAHQHQLDRDRLLHAQQMERDRISDARAIRDAKRARIEQTYRDVLRAALTAQNVANEEQFQGRIVLKMETVAEQDQRLDTILLQVNSVLDGAVVVLMLESDAQSVVETIDQLKGKIGMLMFGHFVRSRTTPPDPHELPPSMPVAKEVVSLTTMLQQQLRSCMDELSNVV